MRTIICSHLLVLISISILRADGYPLPVSVARAFEDFIPGAVNVRVIAQASYAGGTYYVVWGDPPTPSGEIPDSSMVEEATFMVKDGKIDRINGDNWAIPANNYIQNPALADALNDSYVQTRISELGGWKSAQEWLNSKSFITEQEALAWIRAGFSFTANTRLVEPDGQPPFRPISDIEKPYAK